MSNNRGSSIKRGMPKHGGGNMKTKIQYLLVGLSILFIFFAALGENQKSKWKGTIAQEKGVKVIKNPKAPLYGELKFDLLEDLSIGKENDDHYMFYGIRDIKVDGDDNIYVLEPRSKRIQKFDRNGRFLCQIGRQGQGPGEFTMPSSMIIDDKNGNVGIQDMRALKIFGKDGNYLNKDIPFEIFNSQLAVDTKGNLWGIGSSSEGSGEAIGNLFKVLMKYDAQGKVEKKVAKFSYDIFQKKEGGQVASVISVVSGEEYDLFMSPAGEGNVIYGYSKEYEMDVVNPDGNPLLKIQKEEPYQNFTAEEKRNRTARYPEHRPFFYSIFTDSQGRVYARKNNPDQTEHLERRFDIFSKDGYYLYKATCLFHPYIIKNGFFYTQFVNEDTGEVFVKRMRIKNWDQIKAGI
jgi:6-bladed beta-propeller